MIRSAPGSFGLLMCTLVACGGGPSGPSASPPLEPPDRNWGGWWPSAQWRTGSPAPDPEIVLAALRGWERVVYPTVQTPWGEASPALTIFDVKPPFPARRGLSFALGFSGPADDEPAPDPGPIRAEIVSRGKVLRETTNGERQFSGWSGNRGGTWGALVLEFDWLPEDLEDYWLRARIGDRAVWFLLPYGLGCDPKKPIPALAGRSGAPTLPDGREKKDGVIRKWCG